MAEAIPAQAFVVDRADPATVGALARSDATSSCAHGIIRYVRGIAQLSPELVQSFLRHRASPAVRPCR